MADYIEADNEVRLNQKDKKVVLQNDFFTKLEFLKESPNQNDTPRLVTGENFNILKQSKIPRTSRMQPTPFHDSGMPTETSTSSIHNI